MSGLYQRRRKRPELNLVPLIDVLVMIVFFAFVTMQFRTAATLNLTLPKVDTAGKNELKSSVIIGIDKDGTIYFNGKAATETELVSLLRQIKSIDKDTSVLIKADESTRLKELAFVMDACRKTGLNKFSLQSR
ncbi:MAG: biopolymer transporter ExbD [Opitutaceae bacterium]|jgi:biopolymer transport protein ExbD